MNQITLVTGYRLRTSCAYIRRTTKIENEVWLVMDSMVCTLTSNMLNPEPLPLSTISRLAVDTTEVITYLHG